MRTETEERSRPILKRFFVNEDEKQRIEKQMAKAQIENFSTFARLMLTNGQVKVIHFDDLITLRQELHRIGVNINQIAKVANMDESIEQDQFVMLLDQLRLIETKVNDLLVKEETEAIDNGL
ncbi:TPA: plasmid mobilization relaxosome protein MobC [Streptococcus agalactiae]|nr:plasmid mobilization relaxosome protein MobC [Streptococcus agalactiae]